MNRLALVALLVAVQLGCGSETGLIVEVTRDEGAGSLADLDGLDFLVGTDAQAGVDVFVPDPEDKRVELAEGRDVLDSPFRLLLRPGDFGDKDVFDTDVVIAVLGTRNGEVIGYGVVDEPVRFVDGEVRKYTVVLGRNDGGLNPDDRGCIELVVGGEVVRLGSEDDKDCDGDFVDEDCDDTNPLVGPSQQELCENNVDEDCDEVVDEISDDDFDGVTNCDGDCDDRNEFVNPDAEEVCDSIDNNCNGQCDEGFADEDGDGYLADCPSFVREDGSCRDNPPYAADCKDTDPDVHPEQSDPCNGQDDNCNFFCDEDVSEDEDPDGDGFATCLGNDADGLNVQARPGRECLADADCNQNSPYVYPGAVEICDGLDNDCNVETAFIGPAPCFADAGETCKLGAGPCEDNQLGELGGGVEVCTAGNSGDLPSSFCSDGDCLDEPDVFLCQLEAASPKVVDCTVFFELGEGGGELVLCPNRGAAAPSFGTSNNSCSWTILAERGPYKFALDTLEGPQPSTLECDTGALLQQWNPPGTGLGQIFIYGDVDPEDGLGGLFELVVAPLGVPECPPVGLECSSPWDNPLPQQ